MTAVAAALAAFEKAVWDAIAYPVRDVPGWWIHLAVLGVALGSIDRRAHFISFCRIIHSESSEYRDYPLVA